VPRASAASGLPTKYSTTSYLEFIASVSMRGMASHSRSILDPMGVQQRSMASTRLTPSFPALLWNTSRLRSVNLSIHTNLFSSMREMEQMLPILLW